jgi:hypothetical protein
MVPREAGQLHYTLRLDEVVLLVHHDNPIGIHQAVRDEANRWRRNRDAVEVESASRFHEVKQPVLLLDEPREDFRRDVAGRGVKGRPRLDLASSVGGGSTARDRATHAAS